MKDNEDSFRLLQRRSAAQQEQQNAAASNAVNAATEDTEAFPPWGLDAEVRKQQQHQQHQQQQQQRGASQDLNEECGLLQQQHRDQHQTSRLLLHSYILPAGSAPAKQQQHDQQLLQHQQEHQQQHAGAWEQEPSPWHPFGDSSSGSSSNNWQQQQQRGLGQQLRLLLRCLAASPAFLLQQLLQHLLFLVQLLKLTASQAAKLEIWILAAATGIATAAAAVYIQLSSEVIADFRGGLCRDSVFKSQT